MSSCRQRASRSKNFVRLRTFGNSMLRRKACHLTNSSGWVGACAKTEHIGLCCCMERRRMSNLSVGWKTMVSITERKSGQLNWIFPSWWAWKNPTSSHSLDNSLPSDLKGRMHQFYDGTNLLEWINDLSWDQVCSLTSLRSLPDILYCSISPTISSKWEKEVSVLTTWWILNTLACYNFSAVADIPRFLRMFLWGKSLPGECSVLFLLCLL